MDDILKLSLWLVYFWVISRTFWYLLVYSHMTFYIVLWREWMIKGYASIWWEWLMRQLMTRISLKSSLIIMFLIPTRCIVAATIDMECGCIVPWQFSIFCRSLSPRAFHVYQMSLINQNDRYLLKRIKGYSQYGYLKRINGIIISSA